MNFSKIEESLLVIRAGNGHCKEESCEFESGLDMAEKARTWWESGEKICLRNGKYFTAEIPLPKELPKSENEFTSLTFNLKDLEKDLDGVRFQIEVQDFIPTSPDTKGAYRVRFPRFINGSGALLVKDIKVLLNGKYDQVANAFTDISKSVPFVPIDVAGVETATPLLSAQAIIILKDGLANPKLSISFVEIQKVEQADCFGRNRFKKYMLPIFNRVRCDTCHNSEGQAIGTRMLNIDDSESDLCKSTSALVNAQYPMTSPLVSFPVKGTSNHKQLSESEQQELIDAVRFWLAEGQERQHD